MLTLLYSLLFGVYPYICLTVMIVATAYTLCFKSYTITAKSSQFFGTTNTTWPFKGFHASIIFILLGHLGGFLTPQVFFHFIEISDDLHAKIAHVSGGVFGLIALICIILLMYRRYTDARIQAISSFGDNMILIVIFAQLSLGLLAIFPITNATFISPGEKVVLLSNYFQHILMLDFTAYNYLMGLSFITLSHIFLGWTLFLLLPFTRLMHIIVVPLHYLIRTGYQIVRR